MIDKEAAHAAGLPVALAAPEANVAISACDRMNRGSAPGAGQCLAVPAVLLMIRLAIVPADFPAALLTIVLESHLESILAIGLAVLRFCLLRRLLIRLHVFLLRIRLQIRLRFLLFRMFRLLRIGCRSEPLSLFLILFLSQLPSLFQFAVPVGVCCHCAVLRGD